MSVKRVLIIHPHDKTTSFLERIKNHLSFRFPTDVHYFNIKPTELSHSQCLQKIEEHPSNGVIIFLGHGRSDRLFGSKGDSFDGADFISQEAKDAEPEKYYFNDNFIDFEKIGVFKNKKVILISCKSADFLKSADLPFDNNAFLGFGDLPTSVAEFKNLGEKNFGSDLVSTMKGEINLIVKTSLSYSLSNGHSFQDLLNTIRFVTNQRIAFLLVNAKWFRDRHILADYLYFFKNEAAIFGDSKAKIIS